MLGSDAIVLILGMLGVMAATLEVVAVVTELEDWGADVVLGGTAEITQMFLGLMESNFENTTGSYCYLTFISLYEIPKKPRVHLLLAS